MRRQLGAFVRRAQRFAQEELGAHGVAFVSDHPSQALGCNGDQRSRLCRTSEIEGNAIRARGTMIVEPFSQAIAAIDKHGDGFHAREATTVLMWVQPRLDADSA